ncbi:MAG: DUF6636 domain-containing protein [Mycobacterium sp.]
MTHCDMRFVTGLAGLLVALALSGGTGVAAADREVYENTGFTSPSGNIGCYIDTDYIRCDIRERNWEPPPTDCEFGPGQGIQISPYVNPDGPAEFECAGDSAQNNDPPLPYGESITAGPMRCDSAESGITCRNTVNGHGFFISRQAYQLF